MKTINLLKVIFWIVLLFMLLEIVITSLESSLFEEFSQLIQIPWMRATLFDFYANVLVLYMWIAYKEKSVYKKMFWLVFMILLGSVATCVYLLKELHGIKDGEDIKTLLTQQNS